MLVRLLADDTLEPLSIETSIPFCTPLHIRYGNRAATVHVMPPPFERTPGSQTIFPQFEPTTAFIRISTQVCQTLRLPRDITLNLTRDNNSCQLGPCLGIYVDEVPRKERRFGEQTRMLGELSHFARKRGIDLVVLTPGSLESERAWRLDLDSGKWSHVLVSLPDVVLRRSGAFRSGRRNLAGRELALLKRSHRLHTLSRICSNKWYLYRTLRTVPELKPLLPASWLANSWRDVYEKVQERHDVYVKPLNGAQGMSVYHLSLESDHVTAAWEERLVPRSNERMRAAFQARTETMESQLVGDFDFQQFWVRTNLDRCLVQDTVRLPRTLDGRPFDFRWLVQFVSEPHVVARVARIGQPGAVTTNIHTGGTAVSAERVLSSMGRATCDKLLNDLDRVALLVARRLRSLHGPFAELGVDLALKGDGSIAIFEVNPTPGRRMLRSLAAPAREMSLLYLLEYAMHASGFRKAARSRRGEAPHG